MDVYETCPVLQNERFTLRFVSTEDCDDLLRVYSDEKAVPLFNSDNCNGDDFFYHTKERMAKAIGFWIFSYIHHYFVRWSIRDRRTDAVVGTVELFRREAEDDFTDTALLRLDLRSDYEQEDIIISLLSIITEAAYELFASSSITTKAPPCAAARRKALSSLGFAESEKTLKGHDGTSYGSYFIRFQNA